MRNLNTSYPLSELARHIGGTLLGDPTLSIAGLAALEDAGPNRITFIRSSSAETVRRELGKLGAKTAVVVSKEIAPSAALSEGPSLIVVHESYASFLDLIPLFFEEITTPPGIHPTATIDATATIGEGARIGAGCFIGANVTIGKNFTMHPHARIHEDVRIGDSVTLHGGVSVRNGVQIHDRVTIHDNSVIGADGFGYTPDPKVGLRKVPQLGIVVIESDVEIGANTCIDRGAFGPTIIGQGTKIDNLSQIGHNVTIGKFSIVCGNAAIGGSTKIGEQVVIGGRVGLADHLTIADGVRIGGGSGVITSITERGDYMGFPAIPASEWRRIQVTLRRATKPRRKK
jgi:UDP-3-O-[3-hydroxymyristoyl] glucosamine N-acyltransferase